MNSKSEFGRFLSFLTRRKWEIVLVSGTLLTLAAIVIAQLPRSYRSNATVLIEEPAVAPGAAAAEIGADERLQVISRQVVARGSIQQLIDKFNLDPDGRRPAPEGFIQGIRRNITFEMLDAEVTNKRSGSKTTTTIAFTVGYEGRSPEQARQVTSELVSMFIQENARTQMQQVSDAGRVLSEEAGRLEAQMNEISENLTRFKERNAGQTPEMAQTNLQLRERTEAELMENARRITSLAQRKVELETQLNMVKPEPVITPTGDRILSADERLRVARTQLAALSAVYSAEHPDVDRLRREIAALERIATATSASAESPELPKLRAELSTLRQRYSEVHPDVTKVRERIRALESMRATAGSPTTDGRAENPAYIAISGQLSAAQSELVSANARQGELRAKLAEYDRRLKDAPKAEREYGDITRERENLSRRYQDVRAKLMEVEAARKLKRESKTESFSILEPPSLPERAAKPNVIALSLLAILLSVAAGLGVAGVREAMDTTIADADQLAGQIGVPVLARIPEMRVARTRRLGRFQPLLGRRLRRQSF